MHSAKINALYQEYHELIDFCRSNNQVSFEMYINNTYKKTLLLSAASLFESKITNAIHDFAADSIRKNKEVIIFFDNKAIKRQYHTYFNWNENNANQFFGLFGDEFKRRAKSLIQQQGLSEAESTFMAIGRERNRLVHQNFIETQINDTFEEIYEKYRIACSFVELITQLLSA